MYFLTLFGIIVASIAAWATTPTSSFSILILSRSELLLTSLLKLLTTILIIDIQDLNY